jgi:dTDP-L-rhamnose 4-epimerase
VTGGAGFIGSHTVDALLDAGHHVRILDNLHPRIHPHGKPSYISPEAEFLLGDVRNKDDWARALRGIDAVFHFAAYQDYMTDYSTFFHVNAVGTALLYEVAGARRPQLAKIIVASSQAVYGEGQYHCRACNSKVSPTQRTPEMLAQGSWDILCPACGRPMEYLPATEDHANPVNAYGISKLSQEQLALTLGRQNGIPTVALRYSIVQGPRQSLYNAYSGACRIFSLSLFLGKPPVIYEDGRQLRDFVNIRDVLRANLLVLDEDSTNFKVFNVGGGRAYTVLDFYQMAQRVFETEIPARVPGAYRLGDTRHAVSDIAALRSLGWEPQCTPEDSLREYRQYLQEQTDIEDILSYAEKHMSQAGVVRRVRPGR